MSLRVKEALYRQPLWRVGKMICVAKSGAFRKKLQDENGRLQRGARQSLDNVEAVLEGIYKELADREGLVMLFNGNTILNADSGADFTEDVIDILNERLPKIKLSVPDK